MSYASEKVLWHRRMASETGLLEGYKGKRSMPDRYGAVSLRQNETEKEYIQQIEVKFNFVKDHVKSGTVKLAYIRTDNMVEVATIKPFVLSRIPRPLKNLERILTTN